MEKMNRHLDTYMQLEELGSRYPEYRPTYDFPGPYLSPYHQFLAESPRKGERLIKIWPKQPILDNLRYHIRELLVWARNLYRFGTVIPGWLRRDEALKLYELAYFAPGDILELGPYHGLSTSIMAQAVRDCGTPKMIYTVDFDPGCIVATVDTLRRNGLSQGVAAMVDDGAAGMRRFAAAGKRFAFIFIDHSHTYENVEAACKELPAIVSPNTLVFFHDIAHAGNKDPNNKDYGVYQAIHDWLDKDQFEFLGIYGGAGLYLAKK